MTKKMKFLLIFLFLVIETFLFRVFVHYQFINPLRREFLSPDDYPVIGRYLPNYFYWGSIFLIVLFFIVILAVLFLPKEKSSIVLDENKGKLEITKNAIIGLVKSQLNQAALVENEKIKVKMKKRKIDIKIIGSVTNTSSVVGKSNQLIKDLEHTIVSFIGLNTPLKVNVVFNDVPRANFKKKSRVS